MTVEATTTEQVRAITALPETATTSIAPRRRRVWQRPSFLLGAVMVSVVLLLIIVVPLLSSYDPTGQNLAQAKLAPLSAGHLLGTDELGRDVLSRLSLAGRLSMLIALSVVALNMLIGVTLGLLAGYFGGVLEQVVMGVADLQLAIPVLLLLIAIIASVGPGIVTLIVVLGIAFWVRYARVARAIAASLREREFILAPKTQGASAAWIIRRHLLGHILPQLVVMGSFDIGVIVVAEASLSYLGLGIQPPDPSWGGMIFSGQTYLQVDSWLTVLPGIAIFLLLGGIQMLSRHATIEGRVSGLGVAASGR